MRKNILAALAVFIFSGYIGYTTNYTNKSQAKVVVLQPLQVPQTNPGFDLKLDLNSEVAVITDTPHDVINIDIHKKDSVIHDTSFVKKYIPYRVEVEKPIQVRLTPPYAKLHEQPVVLASMAKLQ